MNRPLMYVNRLLLTGNRVASQKLHFSLFVLFIATSTLLLSCSNKKDFSYSTEAEYIRISEESYAEKTLELRIDSLQKVISSNSQNYDAIFLKGYSEMRIVRLEDAEKDFDLLLKSKPDAVGVHLAKLEMYSLWRSYPEDKALRLVDHILELDPDNSVVYTLLAQYYSLKGDNLHAFQHLEKAIDKLPSFSRNYLVLSQIDSSAVNPIEAISKAISMNPKHYNYYFARGLEKMYIGDTLGGIEDFSIVQNVTDDVNAKVTSLEMAALYAMSIDSLRNKAEADLLKVLEMDRESGARDLTAFYLNGGTNREKSYRYIKILVTEYNENPEEYFNFVNENELREYLSK